MQLTVVNQLMFVVIYKLDYKRDTVFLKEFLDYWLAGAKLSKF